MRRHIQLALVCGLTLMLAAVASAQSVEIRLKSGSAWRGELADQVVVKYYDQGIQIEFEGQLRKVTDLYIRVEGVLAGTDREKTIFRDDIISMATKTDDPAAAAGDSVIKGIRGRGGSGTGSAAPSDVPTGVFLLPLEGPVGDMIRHEEIKEIGEHADKFGPSQIIVLKITSNGGMVLEAEKITETIQAVKKRHRVIAWVDKAISAGCSTAMSCNEIYFMTTGAAGSVTTLAGGRSLPEEQIRDHVRNLVEVCQESGYSEHIARSMKFNHYMCSYDKDPETGKVTFYGDMSGEYILSDDKSNLCFNASNALHCGFSKGTADTTEDLAKMLDMPRWREIDDYGRKIAKDWQRTVETAQVDIQRQIARLSYYKRDTAESAIGAQIQILKKLIAWWDRAPNVAFQMLPEKWALERQLEELKKALADLRRAQRGG